MRIWMASMIGLALLTSGCKKKLEEHKEGDGHDHSSKVVVPSDAVAKCDEITREMEVDLSKGDFEHVAGCAADVKKIAEKLGELGKKDLHGADLSAEAKELVTACNEADKAADAKNKDGVSKALARMVAAVEGLRKKGDHREHKH